MIREEFSWDSVECYLRDTISAVLVGPSFDDRSNYFPSLWNEWKCNLVRIEASRDYSQDVTISLLREGEIKKTYSGELVTELTSLFSDLNRQVNVICLDLSSLQHTVLMYLTKLLLTEVRPKQLFASYVEPVDYQIRSYLGDFLLSEELLGLRAVPGFVRRKRSCPGRLLAFLGFEGERLIKILEEDTQSNTIIPVIGFPSFRPGWQARTLRNCMRSIEYAQASCDIHKCSAESIFDAYDLINNLKPNLSKEEYVLAPLGTRPHSMACAIYATLNPDTRIVYDHPVEMSRRSIGINRTICYHLSTFIKR